MEELFANIVRWAEDHREEFIADVMRIVRFPSVSSPGSDGYAFGRACKECADDFMALGKDYGFTPENDDYYCASLVMPGEKPECREIGILGHLDVVPEGEGWDFPPYEPRYIDGYVTGRGAGDNKGPVIMSLYAMRCLKDLGIKLDHSVRLIAGFNEESGMKDVDHYILTHPHLPAVTIICDGGWAMCVGEKGRLNATLVQTVQDPSLVQLWGGIAPNAVPDKAFAKVLKEIVPERLSELRKRYPDAQFTIEGSILTVETRGKATHAFHPQDGVNANYELWRILLAEGLVSGDAERAIRNLSLCFADDYGKGLSLDGEDDVFGRTTCVGGVMRLEEGRITVSVDTRFSLSSTSDGLRRKFSERCSALGVGIEDLETTDGYLKAESNPVVSLLLDTFHQYFDREYDTYVMGGGTHARKFPDAYAFGPAEMGRPSPFGGQAHGKNETCNIDRLLVSLRVYVMSLIRLDEYLSRNGE